MSQQMQDETPTILVGNAARPASPGQPPAGRQGGRNSWIVGGVAGCLVIVLLLACGSVAGWYFLAGPGKASVLPTAVVIASPAPTKAPTSQAGPSATKAATSKPPIATATKAPTAAPATTAAHTVEPLPTLPAGPLVAFTSNRGGNYDVYVASLSQPDTVIDLTKDNPGVDSDPAWSPDGKRLAFSSDRSGALEIYMMDANGANVKQLTHDKSQNTLPTWSPDGTKIAYTSHVTGNLEIFVMKADGTSPLQLTSQRPTDDYAAEWSPDGKQILFLATRDGKSLKGTAEIYVKPSDAPGNARRLIPKNFENVQTGDWAPDGSGIIFAGKPDPNGKFQIFAVQPDGTSLTTLSTVSADETFPSFSPDGKHILFASDRGGNNNLFIMNPDGTGQIQLTNSTGDNVEPELQPGS